MDVVDEHRDVLEVEVGMIEILQVELVIKVCFINRNCM